SNYLVGIPGPQRLDPAGFASGNWTGRYQNMLNEVTLIGSANGSTMTAAQKAATLGFAKTVRAIDLFPIIQTRDTLGAPVDIPTNPSTPTPFSSRDSVLKAVSALLEDAKANLAAGGAAFPFVLEGGFSGFDTPSGFLKFNRAIAAKVLVHRAT